MLLQIMKKSFWETRSKEKVISNKAKISVFQNYLSKLRILHQTKFILIYVHYTGKEGCYMSELQRCCRILICSLRERSEHKS